jgi:hypothetical protein
MRGSLEPLGLEREPYNDIDAHFRRHERFLVIDCVCKNEKSSDYRAVKDYEECTACGEPRTQNDEHR